MKATVDLTVKLETTELACFDLSADGKCRRR